MPILKCYDGDVNTDNTQVQEDKIPLLQTALPADVLSINAARRTCLKSQHEILLLVSSKFGGLLEVHRYGTLLKKYACMFAKDIVNGYPSRTSFVDVTNFSNEDVWTETNQLITIAL